MGSLWRAAVGAAGIVCAFSVAPAEAAVVPVLTVTPGNILAGGGADLRLDLTLQADAGYFNPTFTSGTVTIFSGDGRQTDFTIGGGGTTRSFTAHFDYVAEGDYTPAFTLFAGYAQSYNSYEYLYSQTQVRYETYSYSCGFFSTCYGTRPIYYEVPVYGYVVRTTYASDNKTGFGGLHVTAISAAVPEPSTWAMMLIGFAGVGLVAARRRRPAVA